MLRQRRQYKNGKAQATLEFIVLLFFVMGTILIFQKYVSRGFSGRLKGVGDSLGSGRIYSIQHTQECAFDFQFHNLWYNLSCFEGACDCQTINVTCPSDECKINHGALCKDCIFDCRNLNCID